jgi:NodT family efflux transporter outer membrane factor (OMF) lipoprotein
LADLIDAAQQVSPTMASASARMVQARAAEQIAAAATRPLADASASTSRGRQTTIIGAPLATLSQVRLQASWEADVFGGLAATRSAAQARLLGAQAQWHEARVSVAAEVAQLYFGWRACQALVDVARQDSASRQQTAQLTQLSAQAGLAAPNSSALAQASAAEGAARLTQQQTQCDTQIKGLVALSAWDEPTLRQKLASRQALLDSDALFSIASVPADALRQRPDVFSAEQDVAAASAEVGSAQAERYPRLSLTGSVGQMNLRTGGSSLDISTWSIGPVAVTLPLLDGGKFAANLAAAQARYDEAASLYRAKARQAVREVEEALLALEGSRARRAHVQTATDSYRAVLQGAQARYQAGLGSLAELEDARRSALAAQSTLVNDELETRQAWVSLYRAVGGGWTPEVPAR